MGIGVSREEQLKIHDAVFQISCRFDEKFWSLVQQRRDKLHHKLCLTYEEFTFLISSCEINTPQDQNSMEYYAFEVFSEYNNGKIDCMQTLATLILLSCLDLSLKQQYIFNLYNISKYHQGQLSLNEALMLFRSVAYGALRVLVSIEDPSRKLPSSTATLNVSKISASYFENLIRKIFKNEETISLENFKQAGQENDEIIALLQRIDQARKNSLQNLRIPVKNEAHHDPSLRYLLDCKDIQDGCSTLENKEPQEQQEVTYNLEQIKDTANPSTS